MKDKFEWLDDWKRNVRKVEILKPLQNEKPVYQNKKGQKKG